MNSKSLYYIECTCIKDCKYPNVEFHKGDVVYYNKKAAANEMYLGFNYVEKRHNTDEEIEHLKSTFGRYVSYLPLTRQKKFAKKWEIRRYPEWEADNINRMGEFNCVVKEIKVTYEEEEV